MVHSQKEYRTLQRRGRWALHAGWRDLEGSLERLKCIGWAIRSRLCSPEERREKTSTATETHTTARPAELRKHTHTRDQRNTPWETHFRDSLWPRNSWTVKLISLEIFLFSVEITYLISERCFHYDANAFLPGFSSRQISLQRANQNLESMYL